jgi:NitT/TauT family transport system ATP-binding protein
MTAAAKTNGKVRIEISGVGKRFGALQVFKGVDLAVGEREIVTVVGPSGCGKTTLLRCIDGLVPYEDGVIRIDGAPVSEPRAGVAMVFQHFGLFPWKTVFDNVAYGLKLAGAARSDLEADVPRYIQMVGLKGFEDLYPYQLSGGMQQRCGLARALAVEPSVLLMDEPFAAIDAQNRRIMQREIRRLWRQTGRTIVFVTHSIEEAVLMGDRVVVLKGRPAGVHEVIEVGLPHPRSRATLAEPRFAEVREHVWSTLQDEARKAEFAVSR